MEITHVPVSKSLGNCEHLYNQMSSESLGEFEKVRTRLRQSHAGGAAHFSRQHFIKDRGLYAGHRTVHHTELFLHRQTHGGVMGGGPCLIYDAHCEKDFNCTLWESVEGVDRAERITHKMINQVTPLYTPFQTQPGGLFGDTSVRLAAEWLTTTCRNCVTPFSFWGCFSSELFLFEELKAWKYLENVGKKER